MIHRDSWKRGGPMWDGAWLLRCLISWQGFSQDVIYSSDYINVFSFGKIKINKSILKKISMLHCTKMYFDPLIVGDSDGNLWICVKCTRPDMVCIIQMLKFVLLFSASTKGSFLFSRTNIRQHFFMNRVGYWVDRSEELLQRDLMRLYEDWERCYRAKTTRPDTQVSIPIPSMKNWVCLITDNVHFRVQGRKLDAMSLDPINFFFSLMISPNIESICGKMWTWPDYLVCQTR